jgi:hypothetical protein
VADASDNRAVFTTELKAEGVAETKAQAETVEKLRNELDRQLGSLGKMNQAYRALKVGGLQTSEMAKGLKARIIEQKKVIGENQVALLKMKGGLGITAQEIKKTGIAARGTSLSFSSLTAGANLAGGPIATLTNRAGSLAAALGKAGLIGVALAAVGALIVFDYAIIKTAISLGKMAVASADAYRSERLSIEGMTKVWRGFFGFMQRAPGNAAQMQSAIDDVADRVPLLRNEVVALNAQLYKYGLRGQSLKTALEAVAMGEAAAGEEGKQMGINMVAGAAMFGRSVTGAANIMKSRFGAIVEKQMLALPIQLQKAKYGFSQLFTGLKIDPLLRGLHNILGLFNQGTETSKAWRAIFQTLFNPLFEGAEKGSFTVKRFLQSVTLTALDAVIAWKKLKGGLSLQSLGIGDAGSVLESAINGLSMFAVGGLRAAQATIILADGLRTMLTLLSLAGNFAKFAIGGFSFSGGKKNAEEGIAGMNAALAKLGTTNKTMDAGYKMIEGMIKGIEAGKPALIKAARDSQKAANEAIKDEQKIKSPSRVQFGFGRQMPAGQALGIRAGIPGLVSATRDAQRAVNASQDSWAGRPQSVPQMALPPARGRPAPTIGELHLHIDASKGTVNLPIEGISDAVARIFEGLAIQQGAM